MNTTTDTPDLAYLLISDAAVEAVRRAKRAANIATRAAVADLEERSRPDGWWDDEDVWDLVRSFMIERLEANPTGYSWMGRCKSRAGAARLNETLVDDRDAAVWMFLRSRLFDAKEEGGRVHVSVLQDAWLAVEDVIGRHGVFDALDALASHDYHLGSLLEEVYA